MSVEATRAVWRHSKSKGVTRLVLLAIADNADEGGLAWPGHEVIAEKCRVSRRAVINNIKVLEDLEELAVKHQRNAGNVYLIRVGELPLLHKSEHQKARYKCRFCTLANVNDGASNVNISAFYVNEMARNVNARSHEPSRTVFEPSRTAGRSRGKAKTWKTVVEDDGTTLVYDEDLERWVVAS